MPSHPRWPALLRVLGAFAFALAAMPGAAEILSTDAGGTLVRLAMPARRIVSLAPNITELVYAAGAGERLVGNVDFGNYPAAAGRVSRVGSHDRIDLEAVVALRPDLVLGWRSGNPAAAIARLRALGVVVYLSEPGRIADIAGELEAIGRLAGTEVAASAAARAFRERLAALEARHAGRPEVRVFYQVWKQPLVTVNGRQVISDALRICGGRNIFADLPALAPTVSVEGVLAADPDAIVASGMDEARPEWLDDWRRWPRLRAVTEGNLYFVPPDLIQRHTPRILDGTEILCRHLEAVRAKRGR